MSDLSEPMIAAPAAPFARATKTWLPVWHTRDRKTRIVFGAMVALCVLFAFAEYGTIAVWFVRLGPRWVNQTFLFWGWSRFVHRAGAAALIYNPHTLAHFEASLPGAPAGGLPFAYPPTLLLLIWPLGSIGPVAAYLAWTGLGLAAYVWAGWERRSGARLALLALISPATLIAVYNAQTSLFVAALMIGGCRLAGRRPVLAGVLFGLMAFKPQFGVLLPVALVSARQWRVIVAAGVTGVLTGLASVAAFGMGSWIALPRALAGLSAVVARHPEWNHLAPTVTGGLRMLGAAGGVVQAGQIGAALVAAGGVWFACRRGLTPLASAALMVGAFFATPYAFVYDLPIVAYAAWIVVRERDASGEGFGSMELAVLIGAVQLPALMGFHLLGAPWGGLVLAALFAVILRRIARPAAPAWRLRGEG